MDLVPQPGFELASRALECGVLTTGPPGKSPRSQFLLFILIYQQYWIQVTALPFFFSEIFCSLGLHDNTLLVFLFLCCTLFLDFLC